MPLHPFLLATPLLLITFRSPAQQQFPLLGDSLIHVPETLARLRKTTDSLHRAFAASPPGEPVYSAQQGYGRYFRIFDAAFPLDSLKNDLRRGLSQQDLAQKYPAVKWVRNDVLIYRFETVDWRGEPEQVFAEAPYQIDPGGHDPQIWVHPDATGPLFAFETYRSGDSGVGFLFDQKLARRELPPEASRLVRYAGYMIGPRPHGLFSGLRRDLDPATLDSARAAIRWFEVWWQTNKATDSLLRLEWERDPVFRQKVEATAEALALVGDPNSINRHVVPLFPVTKQYDLLKGQPLNWSCGNDPGPRWHILETSQRAAVLGDWPVFAQAHFIIINDIFGQIERYPHRRSYFRELEKAGLDGPALVLGACLHTGVNRPRGQIENIGAAIRETENPQAFETALLDLIANPKLDDLNRLQMIWLYRRFAHASANADEEESRLEKLRAILPGLPRQIAVGLEF